MGQCCKFRQERRSASQQTSKQVVKITVIHQNSCLMNISLTDEISISFFVGYWHDVPLAPPDDDEQFHDGLANNDEDD